MEEQDHLAVALINLSALAVLYRHGTSQEVLAQTAPRQRQQIDKIQALFSKHGITSKTTVAPWAKVARGKT